MNFNTDENRIDWLDAAKGWGMLAIMIGHLRIGIFTDWLFTFHVPLFFFLSGFVFSSRRKLGDYIQRKAKRILVPYFCLGLPVVVCFAVGGHFFSDFIREQLGRDYTVNGIKDVLQLFGQFLLQQRMWSFWFLTCLFCLNILFYLCVVYIKNDTLLAMLACIMGAGGIAYYSLGGQPLVWNIDICMTAFPFMFAGYYYRKKQEAVESYIQGHRLEGLLFLAFLLVNIGTGYLSLKLSGQMFEMYASSYGIPILSYISAFAGIGFVLILAHKIKWKALRYIGQNSMIFLAWHQIIMIPAATFILSCLHFSQVTAAGYGMCGTVVYKLTELLLILLLCTGCNEILAHSKLKFVLGQ